MLHNCYTIQCTPPPSPTSSFSTPSPPTIPSTLPLTHFYNKKQKPPYKAPLVKARRSVKKTVACGQADDSTLYFLKICFIVCQC